MRLALFVSSLDRIRHLDYRGDRRLYHGADLRRFASFSRLFVLRSGYVHALIACGV
jgi:hypothetical protein